MGRLFKYVFGGIAALFVLAIVAGIIVAMTFDPNDYRDEIIQAVADETGRELQIDGDLGLTIFPVLSVNVGSVRLGNADGFDPDVDFLSLDRAEVSIRVLPILLRREIRMGKVIVDGLNVNLVVANNGANNWSDLADGTDTGQTDEPQDGDGVQIESLEVAGIEFTNASLVLDDRQADTTLRLNNVSLVSGQVASGEPLKLDGGFEFALQPDALSGQLDVAVTLDLQDGVLALTDLEMKARAEGLTTAPLTAAIEAAGVSIDTNAQTIAPGLIQLTAANVDVEADFNAFRYADSVKPQFKLSVAPFSARSLMRELGIEELETADDSVLERVSVETLVQVRDEEIAFQDLTLALDDTTFQGLLRLPRTATGVYRIALAGDTIDLTRYMAPATADASDTADAEANVELPTELIRAFNVDATFKLKEALLGDMRFTDLEVSAMSNNGKLRLFPIGANLFDGSYRGDITIDASSSATRLSVDETIQDVSLQPLMQALFEQQNVTGTINGNFKLAGTGSDLDAIRRDLDGSMAFTLLDGAYEGVDLWYQLRRARALFKQEPAPEREGPARTPFSNVRATGVVTDGVLQNNDFLAELPFMQLSGQGAVNLVDATLDYNAKVVVFERPDFANATEEELAEFAEAEIPLKITGSLSAPTIRPAIDDMLKQRLKEEVSKQALDKLLGDDAPAEGQDVEDALKDKLKDLFKR